MGTADMLVIKRDFGSPCFYIPEKTMIAICNALKQLEEWQSEKYGPRHPAENAGVSNPNIAGKPSEKNKV